MFADGFSKRVFGQTLQAEESCFALFLFVVPDQIGHYRTSFGQSSGLVEDDGINLACGFQTLGIFDQNSQLCPFPDSDHNGSRCGQSESTRAGNDQYGDSCQQSLGKSVGWSKEQPGKESNECNQHNGRNEHRSDTVHQFLYRRLAALCILNHPDDVGQHGITPYLLSLETETAFLVDGAGIDFGGCLFPDRNRFAVQHAFIHIRTAFGYDSVDSDLFSRANLNDIACANLSDGDFLRLSGCIDPGNSLGLKSHQFLDSG